MVVGGFGGIFPSWLVLDKLAVGVTVHWASTGGASWRPLLWVAALAVVWAVYLLVGAFVVGVLEGA